MRADKTPPPLLKKFGWCTWDAFYSSVRPEGVLAGLKGLAQGGVPAKFLILDDGWQSVGNPGSRGKYRGGPESPAADDQLVDTKLTTAAPASRTTTTTITAATTASSSLESSSSSGSSSGATVSKSSSASAGSSATTSSMSTSSSRENIDDGDDEATNLSGTTITGNVGATLATEVSNPIVAKLTSVFGVFYADYVEHAPPNAWTVKLWGFMVRRTMLRSSLLSFFDTFTDFSKRLTSFRANAKFERPSAAQGGLPGDPGATFKDFVREAKQGSRSGSGSSASGSASSDATLSHQGGGSSSCSSSSGGGNGVDLVSTRCICLRSRHFFFKNWNKTLAKCDLSCQQGLLLILLRGEEGGVLLEHFTCATSCLQVYCWHAMPGYWGGVSLEAPAMAPLSPFLHLPQPSPFLREIEPSMLWDPSFLGGVGALRPEKALGMYQV